MNKLPFVKEFSAGGAVFKREAGNLFWLIQLNEGKQYWQLPKGHLEAGETLAQAALREVEEESGIVGRIIVALSPIEYFFVQDGTKIFKHVDWFLMEAAGGSTENYDPKEVDQAKFVTFDEAMATLSFEDENKVLNEANQLVNTGDFLTKLA